MKILVTGGAGFIGSHIVDNFIAAGHEVHIVDDFSTGKRENINPDATFFELDISDGKAISELLDTEKYEIINHHAAQLDVRKSVADPAFDARTNILGSVYLLEGGMRNGLKKFIFASSGGTVYGEQDYFPADEKHPHRPLSPYGIAKDTVESYLYYYHVEYGMPYVALRYGNIYGPRQNPHGEAGVVSIFADRILEGKQPVIYGDGLQTRDYVYVGDVVKANMLALNHDKSICMNVGTAVEVNVIEIFDIVNARFGNQFERKFEAARAGEQRRSVLTNELIKTEMGWEPEYNFQDGMQKTLDWFEEKHKVKTS